MQPPSHPEAVAPERSRHVESLGLRLQVHEWGDPTATPILMSHGMFDHGRGFDLLAPLLAREMRVVAYDHRGHGNSSWSESYPWDTDVADVVNVLRSLGKKSFILGHSKGGGQVIDAAVAVPDRVHAVINLDGFGPPPEGFDHPHRHKQQQQSIPERFAQYLDSRRAAGESRSWRAYESFDALVARRKQQNPLLPDEWLRYFVFHAAREDDDGWRWKVDPHSAGGFGPWKPEWIDDTYGRLEMPMLAVIGSVPDTWGPLPEDVLAHRLRFVRQLERAVVDGAGHFIHMEKPRETAELILDFGRRQSS
jgi:pimeloyl-ACP methyl ester carboxylesterase